MSLISEKSELYSKVQPREIKREFTEREKTFLGYLDSMIKFRSELEANVPEYAEQHKHYKEAFKEAKALMLYMHNLHEDHTKMIPSVLEGYLITFTNHV